MHTGMQARGSSGMRRGVLLGYTNLPPANCPPAPQTHLGVVRPTPVTNRELAVLLRRSGQGWSCYVLCRCQLPPAASGGGPLRQPLPCAAPCLRGRRGAKPKGEDRRHTAAPAALVGVRVRLPPSAPPRWPPPAHTGHPNTHWPAADTSRLHLPALHARKIRAVPSTFPHQRAQTRPTRAPASTPARRVAWSTRCSCSSTPRNTHTNTHTCRRLGWPYIRAQEGWARGSAHQRQQQHGPRRAVHAAAAHAADVRPG